METELYAYGEMGPIASLLVVALTTIGLLEMAVLALVRARKRMQLAKESLAMLDPAHPLSGSSLREGEILLSGVVEHAPGHDVAVRVEVEQEGVETESSGTWSYRWIESYRRVIVAPFYLRLPNGTRVKVLAPPNVEVADALDQKVLISRTSRTLSAELVPGEELHARGWLERGDEVLPGVETGYREAAYGWQLRPANGKMLLSSEPLGAGMLKRASFHRRYGIRAVIAFVILQASFAGYYARALGTVQPATIIHREHSTYQDSDGDTQHRFDLTLQLADGKLDQVEISAENFGPSRQGKVVAIRTGALGWQLGSWPTLHWVHGGIVSLLTISIWILYRVRRRSTRPWFRRTVTHSGSGRLPGD